jgi:hypothetical protein
LTLYHINIIYIFIAIGHFAFAYSLCSVLSTACECRDD